MIKMLKRIGLFTLTAALCIAVLGGCGNSPVKDVENAAEKMTEENHTADTAPNTDEASHKIKFTMENGGEFIIQTEPQYAPETCKNFVKLVNEGFYNGLTFHRVLDGFVAQGGDPNGNGTGGSKDKIKGEFAENGFEQNTLSHTRGVVSMARSQAADSASSQFFICYDTLTNLDGSYAAFGKVIEGMEVIDGFLEVKRDKSGMPETPIVIKEATVIE